MDPLSIAAGIAGLIGLAIDVTKDGYQFVADVKHFERHVREYLQALTTLQSVLFELQIALDTTETAAPLPIQECEAHLKEVKSKLEHVLAGSRLRRLTWPFKHSETSEAIRRLRGYSDAFHAATSAKTLSIVASSHQQLTAIRKDQRRAEILEWLSPLNVDATYLSKLEEAETGTGEWLLREEVVQSWISGLETVLWLRGKPGSGKSVLLSLFIKHLSSLSTKPLYFYFNYQNSVTMKTVLRALLKQAVLAGLSCDRIQPLRDQPGEPQAEDLLDLLGSATDICVLFDAVDECENEKELLSVIHGLASRGIKVCVSSRDTPIIAQEKGSAVRVSARDHDVEAYLRSHFNDVDVDLSSSLRDHFIETIVRKSDGIFLTARLIMTALLDTSSVKEIRRLLEPSWGLSTMYEATLNRISKSKRSKIALKALKWVAFARRPLSMRELQHAVAIEVNDSHCDSESLASPGIILSSSVGLLSSHDEIVTLVHLTAYEVYRTYFNQEEIALGCLSCLQYKEMSRPCGTSAALDERMHRVPLLDYAGKYWYEYVETEASMSSLIRIVLTTEEYLASATQAFYFRGMTDPKQRAEVFSTIPVGRTPMHAASGAGLLSMVEQLLHEDNGITAVDSEGWSPMHLAASYGHAKVLKKLATNDACRAKCLNCRDARGHTPLYWCSIKSHLAAIETLIEAGADLSVADESGSTVLEWAAFKDDPEVTKLLLKSHHDAWASSADFLMEQDTGHSEAILQIAKSVSLSASVHKDASFQELVGYFEKTGLDMDERRGRATKRQLEDMRENMIRARSTKGPDKPHYANKSNLLTRSFALRLFEYAIKFGNADVVDLLLQGNWLSGYVERNCWKRTPLHASVFCANPAVCKVILRHGLKPVKDSNGQTPLALACRVASRSVIGLLFPVSDAEEEMLCDIWHNFNIAPNLQDARDDQVVTAQKLLNTGLRPPLDAIRNACVSGNVEGIKLLVAYGADLNQKDQTKFLLRTVEIAWDDDSALELPQRTVLHDIARNPCGLYTRHFDTESKWSERPAEVEPVGVAALIELGADPNVQNAHGRTALHFALESGNVKDAKVLAYRCDPSILTTKGENAFHFLSMAGLTPYDLQVCKKAEERLAHHASYARKPNAADLREILKILFSKANPGDINVECPNTKPEVIKRPRGGTPLAMAIDFGDRDLVQMLLLHDANIPPPEALTLDWAVSDADLKWFNWLVDRGAKTQSNIVEDVVQAFVTASAFIRDDLAERKRNELRKILVRTWEDDARPWKESYHELTLTGTGRTTTLSATLSLLDKDGDEDDCLNMAKAVVEAGADVMETDEFSRPPIILAKEPRTRAYLREKMLDKGWDINMQTMVLEPLDRAKKPIQLRDSYGQPLEKPKWL